MCTCTATPKKVSDKLKPSCLFRSLEFFITKLALAGIEAAILCYSSSTPFSVHTPREVEEYNRTKGTVIRGLLKFTTVLLSKHTKEAFSVRVKGLRVRVRARKVICGITSKP